MLHQSNLNLKNLLEKILNLPAKSQEKILLDLNEALGYAIYLHYKNEFNDSDKKELQGLMERKEATKLLSFVLERTNEKELQKIIQDESEKIIEDFLQGFMKTMDDKQRQEVLKRLKTLE